MFTTVRINFEITGPFSIFLISYYIIIDTFIHIYIYVCMYLRYLKRFTSVYHRIDEVDSDNNESLTLLLLYN